jgi:uncharacterized repeat protein (TIGR01451 family)
MKKILASSITIAIVASLLIALPVASSVSPINKQLSATSGELGDVVHVTIDVIVVTGGTAVVTDSLPEGLEYVPETFEVDGVPAIPTISGNEVSCALTEGVHIIEFDVKVVKAKNWEATVVSNLAIAEITDSAGEVYYKEDEEPFTILPFEELHKNVGFPEADIMFAVDLTGSMGDEIETIKTESQAIIEAVNASVGDAQFGLISFMDYHGTHSTTQAGSVPVTYSAKYGDTADGDYPYLLDQPLTDDETTIDTAIQAMVLGDGWDGPQDYTRIIHESYTDSVISWRTDSTRFLILFGDNVPHDTNFDNDNDGTLENTGADLGDDSAVGGGDDLDFETEVANAGAAGVHIIGVYSGDLETRYPWTYMATETDGQYFELEDAEDIPDAIKAMLKAEAEETLIVPVETYTEWSLVIDVTNPYEYTMENVMIKDNLGGDLVLLKVNDEDVVKPAGKKAVQNIDGVTIEWTGKTEKAHLNWEIDDLDPGETARLVLLIATDVNPGQKPKDPQVNEYTEAGDHDLNSGATLKFTDPDGTQLSAYTDSIVATAVIPG